MKKLFPKIFVIFLLVLGVVLRLKGLILNPSMWHDECNLGVSIVDFHLVEFFTKRLELGQVAPPLFMAISKLFTNIFGIHDVVLRTLPAVCSIGSLGLFWQVIKKYLNSKTAQITALTVFTLNSALIYYASEFKQYGCDVFATLFVLWIFAKTDFTKISLKKIVLISVLLAVTSLFSFVTLIPIGIGLLLIILDPKTRKNAVLPSIVMVFTLAIYVKIFIFKTYTDSFMVNYWQSDFVKPDLTNFPKLFAQSFKYFFAPAKAILFPLLSFLGGTIYFIKTKNKKSLILFGTLILTIITSILKIYPFGERVILFLLPIYIILIAKPLDIGGKLRYAVLVLLVITFFPTVQINARYLTVKNVFKKEPAREFAEHIAKNSNSEDTIFINAASIPEYRYYSHIFGLKNPTVIELPENNLLPQRNEEIKNQLKNMHGNIWFYMPFDIPHRSVNTEIADYVKKTKTVYEDYAVGTSYLLYAKF